jgi:enamine deaminase RidA (YjgF/YER057c/UK114 family)
MFKLHQVLILKKYFFSSHAIRVNDTLYVSGMLGVDPTTGALVDGGIEAETRRALQTIGLILTAANTTYENGQEIVMKNIKSFVIYSCQNYRTSCRY